MAPLVNVSEYIGAYNIFLCSFDSLISSLMYAKLLRPSSTGRTPLTTNDNLSSARPRVGVIRVISAAVGQTFRGSSIPEGTTPRYTR